MGASLLAVAKYIYYHVWKTKLLIGACLVEIAEKVSIVKLEDWKQLTKTEGGKSQHH